MLEIYEYDKINNIKNKSGGMIAVLNDAWDIHITKEINSCDNLNFKCHSRSEKAHYIKVNRLINCQGQAYRIVKVAEEAEIINVDCVHIWFLDSMAVHIPGIKDNIGVTPYSLIKSCFDAVDGFEYISKSEIEKNKMAWIGTGNMLENIMDKNTTFAIDFFAVDKTNLLDFIKNIISNAGFGEMYYDNNYFALVEQIGKESNLILSLANNVEGITVETDVSSLITRLYPYGHEDLTVSSVNGKKPYIDSVNAGIYGIKEGYKDYSDYTEPKKLLYNARWEFDENNPDRIDVPAVTINATVLNLSKLAVGGGTDNIALGDTVTVIDYSGNRIKERVIAIDYYPFEDYETRVTIGRVKRDLFFYVSQIANLAKRYSKYSTGTGKISSKAISGTVKATAINISSKSTTTQSEELISVIHDNNTMVKIGISNGDYVFNVCDGNGDVAISSDGGKMDFEGGTVKTEIFTLNYDGGSFRFTADKNGVYINGKKIVTESEGE